jgi:hypothetical protein
MLSSLRLFLRVCGECSSVSNGQVQMNIEDLDRRIWKKESKRKSNVSENRNEQNDTHYVAQGGLPFLGIKSENKEKSLLSISQCLPGLNHVERFLD